MYDVYEFPTLARLHRKLDPQLLYVLENLKRTLLVNQTGKILGDFRVREKKYGVYRIIYVVFDDLQKVLIMSICTKKNQQAEIDFILKSLPELRAYVFRQA